MHGHEIYTKSTNFDITKTNNLSGNDLLRTGDRYLIDGDIMLVKKQYDLIMNNTNKVRTITDLVNRFCFSLFRTKIVK